MKKIFTLLLCVFIITGLIGCSGSGSSKTSTQTAASEATATASTEKLSDIANDSYIIYNYSYTNTNTKTGYILANGQPTDINSNFTAIK